MKLQYKYCIIGQWNYINRFVVCKSIMVMKIVQISIYIYFCHNWNLHIAKELNRSLDDTTFINCLLCLTIIHIVSKYLYIWKITFQDRISIFYNCLLSSSTQILNVHYLHEKKSVDNLSSHLITFFPHK